MWRFLAGLLTQTSTFNFDLFDLITMYKLYGFPFSRTSRVIWTLYEIGIDFEFIKSFPHSEQALTVNPSGKLPVLEDNGVFIIDSTAICTYLADKHYEAKLSLPAGTIERALLDSWIQFAINDLEAPLWVIAKHTFVIAEEHRVPEILVHSEREWHIALQVMEKRLGDNKYVMGDQFTVADIILGQIGGRWAKRRGIEIKSDSLNDYFDRVCNRPAIVKALNYEQQVSES